MSKNIIISIAPHYVSKILSGSKTIELRKRIGKEFQSGNTLYIYATTPVKSIVGYTQINDIECIDPAEVSECILKYACVNSSYFNTYFKNSNKAYLIHLENATRFKKNISIETLRKNKIHPPQSFCYTETSIKDLI